MDAEGAGGGQACPDREADLDDGRRDRHPHRRTRQDRASRGRGLHDRPPSAMAARARTGAGRRDRQVAACGRLFQLQQCRRTAEHPQQAGNRRRRHSRYRRLHLWIGPVRDGGRGARSFLPDDPREWRRCLGTGGCDDRGPPGPGNLYRDDVDADAEPAGSHLSWRQGLAEGGAWAVQREPLRRGADRTALRSDRHQRTLARGKSLQAAGR